MANRHNIEIEREEGRGQPSQHRNRKRRRNVRNHKVCMCGTTLHVYMHACSFSEKLTYFKLIWTKASAKGPRSSPSDQTQL